MISTYYSEYNYNISTWEVGTSEGSTSYYSLSEVTTENPDTTEPPITVREYTPASETSQSFVQYNTWGNFGGGFFYADNELAGFFGLFEYNYPAHSCKYQWFSEIPSGTSFIITSTSENFNFNSTSIVGRTSLTNATFNLQKKSTTLSTSTYRDWAYNELTTALYTHTYQGYQQNTVSYTEVTTSSLLVLYYDTTQEDPDYAFSLTPNVTNANWLVNFSIGYQWTMDGATRSYLKVFANVGLDGSSLCSRTEDVVLYPDNNSQLYFNSARKKFTAFTNRTVVDLSSQPQVIIIENSFSTTLLYDTLVDSEYTIPSRTFLKYVDTSNYGIFVTSSEEEIISSHKTTTTESATLTISREEVVAYVPAFNVGSDETDYYSSEASGRAFIATEVMYSTQYTTDTFFNFETTGETGFIQFAYNSIISTTKSYASIITSWITYSSTESNLLVQNPFGTEETYSSYSSGITTTYGFDDTDAFYIYYTTHGIGNTDPNYNRYYSALSPNGRFCFPLSGMISTENNRARYLNSILPTANATKCFFTSYNFEICNVSGSNAPLFILPINTTIYSPESTEISTVQQVSYDSNYLGGSGSASITHIKYTGTNSLTTTYNIYFSNTLATGTCTHNLYVSYFNQAAPLLSVYHTSGSCGFTVESQRDSRGSYKKDSYYAYQLMGIGNFSRTTSFSGREINPQGNGVIMTLVAQSYTSVATYRNLFVGASFINSFV